MPSSHRPILLVIPAFRESQRLPKFLPDLCQHVATMEDSPVTIQVVDDGSGTSEQKVVVDLILQLRQHHDFLNEPILLQSNRGKGGAVYAGWDANQSENYSSLGFVDADGAISGAEVVRVLAKIPDLGPSHGIYAARLNDADQAIKRTLIRKWLGLVFRRITKLFFHLPINDSQCGFKFVPAAAFHQIRNQLTELRYCFDIDLTIHLIKSGIQIKEVPISWTETPGTKLTLSQASKMLASLLKLRSKVG